MIQTNSWAFSPLGGLMCPHKKKKQQIVGPGLCFEDQHEAPANIKVELPAPREALILAGHQMN